MNFGNRLREERERRRLNQTEFAALGGVKRVSQHLYEQGERFPDVRYLQRLIDQGVDVRYLLFGRRAPAEDGGDLVTLPAQLLSNIFDAVDEFARDDLGEPLPLEERRRVFHVLCAALSGSTQTHTREELRGRLARFAKLG